MIAALAIGCGAKETPPPTPPQTAAPASASIVARLQTVDLENRPLANMIPLVTREPNAFDRPLATGEPTKEDGSGSVVAPAGERVYIRAWDPALKMFANTFFEIGSEPGDETELMRVVMVPGASLDAVLLNPDGQPAASVNVGLMMFHPTRGPWWPAEADTDPQGALHFNAVPAGVYKIKLRAATGAETEIPQVELAPSGHVSLGQVKLHPASQ